MTTNYAWSADGYIWDLFETDEPVDNDTVFATFAGARGALAEYLTNMAADYRAEAAQVRKARKRKVLK